ncbi:peptidoglycan-binding protein [Solwaraspora sp. WMMD1047]|uniref:peptidoglycan-binding protein n=1 Tax=Solwaraspora sp. WMMD1047 TaxID=3016102 RepID=UPI0024160B39|nr:peptidoglycan-binding protein [Solwaraspora sp. WMMD1047]MDG4833003.1 peptidoglycan-binding protein [Solwaraspora sp. WMMD1047]
MTNWTTSPAGSTGRRATTSLAGTAAILVLLVGIPYALYRLAGNPLPESLPDWSTVVAALTSRDDGSVFLTGITLAGWLGWASFAVPLLVEIPFQLLRRRPPRLFGLAWQQRRAAVLVAAALAIIASPAAANASAAAAAVAAPAIGQPVIHGPATGFAATTFRAAGPQTGPVYAIEHDDWLFHVAERYLGDGDRYREIARINPELRRADPRFPDHIQKGQRVRLPADAHDRGPRAHATGDVLPGTGAERRSPNERPRPSPRPTTSPSADPAPTPSPSAVADPDPTASVDQEPAPADDDELVNQLLPVAAVFATAGMLTALLLVRLAQRRQRQRQFRRPNRRIIQPADPKTEVRARAAARPTDINRLDVALRGLAAGLRDREGTLPDIAAAWMAEDELHLVLASPDHRPPAPYRVGDGGRSWNLDAKAELPEADDLLAPVPALATIASRPGGEHLLVDLERTGVLSVGGSPERSADLLRYLAAELATAQWSDDVEILLAGFDPADAENLAALSEDRVRIASSVTDAISRVRRRATGNATALADRELVDAFEGRVRDVGADAWMPLVLLIADPQADGDSTDEVTALEGQLRITGRCGVAAVVATPTPAEWHIEVAADGTLGVDWLSITSATGVRLPSDQLAQLAAAMRTARAAATGEEPADEPVPPAPEPERWAAGTDAHGHLLDPAHSTEPEPADSGRAQTNSTDARDDDAEQERRPVVPDPTQRVPALPEDPELDADLAAWRTGDPDRPRIAILGPVLVEAPGEPPEERRRFYSEIIVYLAQRGRTGATGEQIDDALWPGTMVNARSRRVAISKARRWLGETPDGAQWLPPNSGVDRRYRLTPGYLLDWQLFRRLRARGERCGPAGADDLRQALDLVRGEPLAGAELPYSSGYRNPYTWLPDSTIQPHNLASAVVDTAHQLAEHCLAQGDTAGARWAVERAWQADPARVDDHPWIDAMRAAHADGRTAELRTLLDDLVRIREVEVPEELAVGTYAAIHRLVGDLLRTG